MTRQNFRYKEGQGHNYNYKTRTAQKKSQRHGVAIMNLRCDSAGRVLDTSPTLFRLNINLYYFSRIESHLEKHYKHFELRSIRGVPKGHLFTLLESNEEGNDAHWDASFDPRL